MEFCLNFLFFRLLRKRIIEFSCQKGLEDCVLEAKKYYKEYMDEGLAENLPKNYRSLIFCTSIRQGSNVEWSFAHERYLNETDLELKKDLEYGMSCTREPWLLNKYLKNQFNQTLTKNPLEGISFCMQDSYSTMFVWDFVKTNWNFLLNK